MRMRLRASCLSVFVYVCLHSCLRGGMHDTDASLNGTPVEDLPCLKVASQEAQRFELCLANKLRRGDVASTPPPLEASHGSGKLFSKPVDEAARRIPTLALSAAPASTPLAALYQIPHTVASASVPLHIALYCSCLEIHMISF